eukprot:TRINITY_DN4123_c0_g1_i1.p1 TRINITY_DN4123_c0_g1~~TRINITY_DN4123_c0_g1_i1.p1  ORF type:complete len:219 (-),score=42.10 TRINITY_DN4123_c0_g1_i1:109-765(-)
MAPTLCYWNSRGLGQPIRLLLEFTGTEFEDRKLTMEGAPTYDKSCWTDIKDKLGLDFPNLPYFVDGNIKITQSNAILRHIARKNGLCGESVEEKARVDMMADCAMDLRNTIARLVYNPDYDNLLPQYIERLPSILEPFSKFLAANPWFVGQKVTFVDFPMYELLDQLRSMIPNCLKNYPNLIQFLDRFEKLPKIAAYMKSSRYMAAPINNKHAKFGGK